MNRRGVLPKEHPVAIIREVIIGVPDPPVTNDLNMITPALSHRESSHEKESRLENKSQDEKRLPMRIRLICYIRFQQDREVCG